MTVGAQHWSDAVVKGHGTGNDFLLIPDLDGSLELSASLVRALCDRHTGIGADGVLRVLHTRASAEPMVSQQAAGADFFMDYRNADGSVAEMCGNGVRVFARYLAKVGLINPVGVEEFAVATRGGVRRVWFAGGDVSVDMGPVRLRAEQPCVRVPGMTDVRKAVALDAPNPHVVVEVGLAELGELDLSQAPVVESVLPDGQNVEFVARLGQSALRMRVFERGVGETQSCGTGICAAVAAMAGSNLPQENWTVDVPGGRCSVRLADGGSLVLTGPAVLTAELRLDPQWLGQLAGETTSR